MSTMNSYLRIVLILISFLCCEGQLVASNSNTTSLKRIFPKIPQCCQFPNEIMKGKICETLPMEPTYTHFYFDSNKTHIDSEKHSFNLTFYYNNLGCKDKWRIDYEDIIGFIYNGSFIEATEMKLYNATDYCVNSNGSNKIFILMCDTDELNLSKGQVYFPCLIVSTLCYIFSAIIYRFVLNVKDVHKKCFIGYTSSMAVTFFFLILLQKITTGCAVLGSIFFLFILSSFIWLSCLCIDMVYIVRNCMNEDRPERFFLYIAGSLLIPSLMLLISLIPSGSPDVPNSFMKGRGMCTFKECRITVLFVPIGISLLLSIGALIYTFYLIRINDEKYATQIKWLERKSQFKYMTRSCLMIWLPSFIWVIDAALENVMKGNPLVYEIIEGSQGIFVVAVFVLNRYTRKEIYNALFGEKHKRDPSSKRFNKLLEKFRNESKSADNVASEASEDLREA